MYPPHNMVRVVIATRMSWAVHEVHMRDMTNTSTYKILVGILLGKGSLAILTRRWEGNIQINFK
jgi:hypothetical protein